MEKICKKHGLTEFSERKNDRSRCKKCTVAAVDKRRRMLKQMALDHKGHKCEICSYNKCDSALEFHHRDPSKKDFGISGNKQTAAWSKIKEEVDKCMLLCANCHREEHERLRNSIG